MIKNKHTIISSRCRLINDLTNYQSIKANSAPIKFPLNTDIKCLQFALASCIIFFSCILNLQAQVPAKQWDLTFGGSTNDILKSVQQTTDSGYVLGGYSNSGISGNKTQVSNGDYDYWMVKTNINGVKQWDVAFGGNHTDALTAMQKTSDSGFVLGGYSNSGISGDKTQASKGGNDYWIVKISSNGVKQWDATFGGNDDDILNSIQQTSDGGYILGGYSISGISGDKTQASQGGNDYWIVKTNSSGIKQWDATFGGSSTDILTYIKQTSDGGYVLGGYSGSGISGDKTQASQGGNDYWIVKLNSSGAKQWDARFGGFDDDNLNMLKQTTGRL